MKKLFLILFIVPLFSSFSFGSTEHNHSLNVSSIIEDSNFIGIWKDEDDNHIIIWIDSEDGEYNFLLMSGISKGVKKTLSIDLIGNSLVVESIFLKTNWKTKGIYTLIDNDTLNYEFINKNGSHNSKLIRVF